MLKAIFFLIVMGISQYGFGQGAVISFGGGDLVSKVYDATTSLSRRIANVPQFLLPKAGLYSSIQNELNSLSLEVSETPLYWEGNEVLAINYPYESPKRIQVSRVKWNKLETQSPELLERIVLHEFLPLTGTPDRNYEISEKILKVLTDWKSWDSTEYFIRRYLEDESFLQLWSQKSKDYYENWGLDGDQLVTKLAFFAFPIKNSDSIYWKEIFKNYLNQYSQSICTRDTMVAMLNSLGTREQIVFQELHSYAKTWFQNKCKLVPNSLKLK